MTLMSERRRHPRIDKTVHVILRWPVPTPPGKPTHTATTVGMTANVSQEGIMLFAKDAPIVGTPVALTIAWDSPPAAFEHRGRVIRCFPGSDERQQLAVKFSEGDEQQNERWLAFCDKVLVCEDEAGSKFSFDSEPDQ